MISITNDSLRKSYDESESVDDLLNTIQQRLFELSEKNMSRKEQSIAEIIKTKLDSLEENYPEYSKLMRPQGVAQVAKDGFFSIDRDNDLVTPTVDGSGECAYTTFDDAGNCFCAIERCYFAGTVKFRKPQSCWLYPIRVTKLSDGGLALNLHRWGLCKDAYEKGKREGIRVYEFLREPLSAIFGEDFYSALEAAARHIILQESRR